ncbi:MAG: hemolysin family protein [Limnobacter sp.]|uniref:hemolysin family protein n=1 Tax=Limnobacter sp. TaxID=2003368 RepID=UPI00391D031D
MEVLILLGLIVLNGLFAMSEIALVTARKARLAKLAADGDTAAEVALKLGEDPTKFLSTIQIGITSIGVLSGIVGEAVLAKPLAVWMQKVGIDVDVADVSSTAIVVVLVTYVAIVVGELVPKRLGQISPEMIARLAARPMQVLAVATRPFVVLLTYSTRGLLRLLGVKENTDSGVTEEEIHAMLDEGSVSGAIEQTEHTMLRNVFRLDDRQLGSLMIPRSDVLFLDITLPKEENLKRVIESEYSRFPVCDGSPDRLLGVIHAKQALAYAAQGKLPDFTTGLQACVYVPETLTGMELLEQFRTNSMDMAFVIDEYGELEGIVTLHDLMEALTGEFKPRNVEDSWAVQREDGSWLLDGAIAIHELKDTLAIKSVPEEEKGRYHTLSGMVMLLTGRLPNTGDVVEWDGWRFEVVDMDQKRIDKILASRMPEPVEGDVDEVG